MLLEFGHMLSSVGTQTSSIAYPLLTLAVTHSPALAGVVGFARAVPAAGLACRPAWRPTTGIAGG
jgi:hypothetical protein